MMFNPVVQTFKYAFSNVSLPFFETQFTGVDNFKRVLSMPEVGTIFKNTFFWIIGAVILRFSLGFAAALVMDGKSKLFKVMSVIAMLPWTVPSIVAANIWRWMLQSDFGLINGTLRALGLGFMAANWLGSSRLAFSSVLVAYAWSGFPFVMLLLLSGMQGIPAVLYESGKIDGANSFQLFTHITIPSLKSVIFIAIILEAINALNSFDLLYLLTGGGPGHSSEILGLFIYRLGFTDFDFAGASAVSVVVFGIAALGFLLYAPTQFKKARKGE